jgi:hypothetical protein
VVVVEGHFDHDHGPDDPEEISCREENKHVA